MIGEKQEEKICPRDIMTQNESMLIQETLPSFLSSNPHSSCSVTWSKTIQKNPKNKRETVCMHSTITMGNQECSRCSCCSWVLQHWPIGGTAQMQRAGAVGGRLNWSSTALDRAGSITVMLLLQAGPETTHTEHWHRRRGTKYGNVINS